MFEKKPPTPRAVALHDALLEAGCYNTLEERISVIPPTVLHVSPIPTTQISGFPICGWILRSMGVTIKLNPNNRTTHTERCAWEPAASG
jgi:hypothetical protein